MKTTTLTHGDTGLDVVELQELLNRAGIPVATDGWFGERTAEAVRQAQRRFGLVVDGLAGRKTLTALRTGIDDPRHLREADLIAAAERLGVPLASIKAINQVESNGTGFLPDGRPVLLLERHVLYRQLKAAGHDADALALRYPQLVGTQRGGYAGGTTEWHRYQNARHIDAACAIEACSWGLFQIMGFHWQGLGYASAQAFADAMVTSEAQQLAAFVGFIEAEPALHKALKAKKWAEFARLYNGPSYRENDYDLKLARAFERFDTAAVPA
ncbi:DUF3380 domain-containing protein [Chitinimonas arctica]|uniref:DUF3380 domain-containing protein n=1 Tax=Chitinimonas arctica TaxID=2594795 RepID=A0A516SLX3_9NEIS|nr:N-acetylmuramidase family protein [Chitinimonas arctica]QDQ29130.1 DUF3380 domain-containing protein [Chitinimonas arctica]